MKVKVGTKEKTYSQTDEFYLDNDLLSKDDWIFRAIDGKINNCKKRAQREWIPKLRKRGSDIPSNEVALVVLIRSQSDYKNRKDREKEEDNNG